MASDVPFLGICLGAQLLARVLGAAVSRHPEGLTEIGYYPVQSVSADFSLPSQVFHWHLEGVDLPQDAVLLAEGETFNHQAFRYGDRAYGVQFHPEVTDQILDRWTTVAADMLSLPGAQSREEQQEKHARYQEAGEVWLSDFLDQWLR